MKNLKFWLLGVLCALLLVMGAVEGTSIGPSYTPTFGSITTNDGAGSTITISGFKVMGVTNGLQLDGGASSCVQLASQNATIVTQFACPNGSYFPLFYGLSGSQVKSAKMYAFLIANNGTTCTSVQAMPVGWSVARTATGKCTITFPTISNGSNMIVIPAVNSITLGSGCEVTANTTTTTAIQCFVTTTATDLNFFVILQDWN